MPDRPHTTTRRLAAILAVGAGLLAAAAPASADSIAYVKGGDVWLSTSDGSRHYQVTRTGGYSTVSQSDYGRLVALHGDRIAWLERDGTVLSEIRTPASSSFPGTQFRGPFDPVISPDGVKVAYTWYWTQYGETPSCNPSTGCQTVYGRQGTGYTRTDQITGFDALGFQSQSGWVSPSWQSDGGTILSDPIQVGNPDVVIHTPGDEHNGMNGGMNPWFFDPDAHGLRDGEMTRDAKKIAFVAGNANQQIRIYRALGGWPKVPEGCFGLTGGEGRYQQPTWSPDGTTLAFADDRGVHVIGLPDMSNDCGRPTEDSRLLIEGASHPDWGPADVPPARSTPGPGPGPGPGGPGGPGPGPGTDDRGKGGGTIVEPGDTTVSPTPPGGGVRTTVPATKLKTALRKGLVVRLAGAKPGKVKLAATAGRKVVAKGSATVSAAGTAKVTLRFTAKGKAALKGKRTVRLAITGGGASRSVTLKK